jgi:hypothetical protein
LVLQGKPQLHRQVRSPPRATVDPEASDKSAGESTLLSVRSGLQVRANCNLGIANRLMIGGGRRHSSRHHENNKRQKQQYLLGKHFPCHRLSPIVKSSPASIAPAPDFSKILLRRNMVETSFFQQRAFFVAQH